MFLGGGRTALLVAPQVAGDLPTAVEDVNHLAAQAVIDLLADILVGDRVEPVVDRDVVIGVDRVLAPDRALPVRQRVHLRQVNGLEALVAGRRNSPRQLPATAAATLHRLGLQVLPPETVCDPVRHIALRVEGDDLARMADHDPIRSSGRADVFQKVAGDRLPEWRELIARCRREPHWQTHRSGQQR